MPTYIFLGRYVFRLVTDNAPTGEQRNDRNGIEAGRLAEIRFETERYQIFPMKGISQSGVQIGFLPVKKVEGRPGAVVFLQFPSQLFFQLGDVLAAGDSVFKGKFAG